jgi:hypothetical protein
MNHGGVIGLKIAKCADLEKPPKFVYTSMTMEKNSRPTSAIDVPIYMESW